MTDLQATLDEIPFASTSQQDAPTPCTFTLLSSNLTTPYPWTHTPLHHPLPTVNADQFNKFMVTYNAWHELVQRVGIKHAGLPPQLQYIDLQSSRMELPTSAIPTPILIHSPPHPYSQFSLQSRDSFSSWTSHVHLPLSLSWPPQLRMTIPPLAPTAMNNNTKGLGKSVSAKPDMFNGDKSKYVQWSRQITVYFAGFDNEPSDTQKY